MTVAIDLTINVPSVAEVKDFCYYHGYTDTIIQDGVEIPNPIGRQVFAKQIIKKFVRGSIETYRANQAAELARIQAAIDANNLVIT